VEKKLFVLRSNLAKAVASTAVTDSDGFFSSKLEISVTIPTTVVDVVMSLQAWDASCSNIDVIV
jgi:hypothetical protein